MREKGSTAVVRRLDHKGRQASPTSAVCGVRARCDFKYLTPRVGTTLCAPRGACGVVRASGDRGAPARPLGRDRGARRSAIAVRGRESAAVGRMTSVLVMAASSWRRVGGELPRPARLCHCSSVFHQHVQQEAHQDVRQHAILALMADRDGSTARSYGCERPVPASESWI